mgnify:CR=1 FL=1
MEHNDMTAERPSNAPDLVRATDPPAVSTPADAAGSGLPTLGSQNFINQLLRREVRQRRASSGEELFMADLDRISRLVEIQHRILVASSLTTSSQPDKPDFPNPDDYLVRYRYPRIPPIKDGEKLSPRELQEAIGREEETARAKLRETTRLATENGIKATLTQLTADIRTLYLDRALTEEDIEQKIQRLTTPKVRRGTKQFGLLSKDGQMAVLNRVFRLRNGLIRENLDYYLYFTSGIEEAAGIDPAEIAQIRDRFAAATPDERVSISIEARNKTLSAMDTSMAANIDRLRQIEGPEEGIVPIADKLGDAYEKGSLPVKGKILERVLDRKVDLSLPHLHDIFRLRRILEHAEETDQETIDPEGRMTKQARLLAEVARIDTLIRRRLAVTIYGGIKRPFGELSVDDMEEEIADIAAAHKDPSLLTVFQRILLLRTTSSDLLDL